MIIILNRRFNVNDHFSRLNYRIHILQRFRVNGVTPLWVITSHTETETVSPENRRLIPQGHYNK